jgi:hypothetical protein
MPLIHVTLAQDNIRYTMKQLIQLRRQMLRAEHVVGGRSRFLGARIRNDKCSNCQNAANDQHQENRPAQKAASRLDRRLY